VKGVSRLTRVSRWDCFFTAPLRALFHGSSFDALSVFSCCECRYFADFLSCAVEDCDVPHAG